MTLDTRSPRLEPESSLENGDLADLLAAYQYLQGRNARMATALSAGLGVGPADLRVLLYLSRMPDATPKEVAMQMEQTSGSITALLDRLEANGHIERRPHPTDRRSLTLRLTVSGAAVVRRVHGAYHEAFDGIFPAEDIRRAADILRALGGALRVD